MSLERESMSGYWKIASPEDCELTEPLECPTCKGHVALDVTFLDQVDNLVTCPYCGAKVYYPDD